MSIEQLAQRIFEHNLSAEDREFIRNNKPGSEIGESIIKALVDLGIEESNIPALVGPQVYGADK